MQKNLEAFESSRALYEEASRYIPGGVHSGFRYRSPHPIYFKRARGPRVWDVDGNEYVDCIINMGACILGHGNPKVVAAVREQLETGLTVGLETELSVQVARQLNSMIPSAESVKLSNTGTEAVLHSIQIARGYTGKQKIIKVEGCYDGWFDEVHVSVHPSLGKNPLPSRAPIAESGGFSDKSSSGVRVVPYNDAEALRSLIREEGEGGFAAMIVEPIMFNSGCVLPKEGYLKELREVTEKHGILLIFDEVITGFRTAPGGAQEYYGVKPDISVFGKAIANGFPLSAVVGRRDVMDVTTPVRGKVVFAGTYNGSQPSLAASRATLEELKGGKVQERLHTSGSRLQKEFARASQEAGVSARMPTMAGKFQFYFTDGEVTDYRSAAKADATKYAVFASSMLESGVLLSPAYLFHHGVSDAHTDEDSARIVTAAENALKRVKKAAS